MLKILLIIWLQFLKSIIGSHLVQLRIRGGPNAGRLWKFGSTSNNEFIIGDWESSMQKLIRKYLKKGDVVLDLGAHQGFLAMMMTDTVGAGGKVYAFEPLPKNYGLLEFHIRVNSIDNCITKHGAVARTSGTVQFTTSAADVSNTYVHSSPAFSGESTTVDVPSFSLDDLLENASIPCPQFIKVDVEGAEYDVLLGAMRLLTTCSPIIYLETHDVHNPGVDANCKSLLATLGFDQIEAAPESVKGLAWYVFKKRLLKS